MKQTAAARRRYSKASGYKSCKPGSKKSGCTEQSYLPPGFPEQLEGKMNSLNGNVEAAKWAMWFLSQFLTNPKKEKTETYEQLLLRLYRMNFAPAGADIPGFRYPLPGTLDVTDEQAKKFAEYLQSFYKPLNAKAAAAFGENLALVHAAVEARTKHEIQARVSQDSLKAEYNPRAKVGEPIQAARTMCGRIVYSGGRLWYAEAPMKRTAYGDVFDASKTCKWVALTSESAIRGVLRNYTEPADFDAPAMEKMEKDKQIAELTVKIQTDITERMNKLKTNGDLLEHARLAKQISTAHTMAKKMIEKQMKIDEQYKHDLKKFFMADMARKQHHCALSEFKLEGYECDDENPFLKLRNGYFEPQPKTSTLQSDSKFMDKWSGADGRMYRNQAVGGAKGRKAVDPKFSLEGLNLPSFLTPKPEKSKTL